MPGSSALIGYFPHKHVPGIAHPDSATWDEGVAGCICAPLTEALNTPHQTDAHLILYRVPGEEMWPRINKPALPHVRAAGGEVEVGFIVLDYDNPDHGGWTDASLASFFEYVEQLADDGWPFACLWSAIYTTRGGARFVFTCDEPLDPLVYERKVAWIIKEFGKVGIEIDAGCWDWTRLFRLPDVKRDGEQQGEQDWFVLMEQDETLPVDDIPEANPSELRNKREEDRGIVEETNDPQPPEDEVLELLETKNAQGRFIQTEWAKWAKRQLKGRDYFDALFNEEPLAEEGERNETLFETTSSVIGLLFGRNDTTREQCYALLLRPTLALEPDNDTPDWTAVLWSMVQRIWAREVAKEKAEIQNRVDRHLDRMSTISRMAVGAKEWAKNQVELKDDETQPLTEQSREWIDTHAIACPPTASELYIMQEDGLYYPMPFSRNTLIPGIRKLLGPDIIPTTKTAKDGTIVDRHVQEVINAHATIVSEVVYEPSGMVGGFIRHTDTPRAQLAISPYMRNPELTPKHNPHVEEWLRRFFGKHYEDGIRWIAWALAWEEGAICALSLSGPTGSGKTLLAEGLKECLAVPAASDFGELTGEWQYGLAQSPFVLADEGFDEFFRKGHPADVFRRLIGKSAMSLNRKRMTPIKLNTDCRILFTANNHSLIHALVGQKDITPEDRDALLVRLAHYDLDDDAAIWLEMNGGRRFTQGWISDNRNSDYVVARHFLHLYEQRASLGRDDRLLVEGNMSDTIMNELRLHSGAMDRVVEAIVRMAELKPTDKRRGNTQVRDNQLFMLPSDVHAFIADEMGYRNLRIGTVQTVMRNLLPSSAAGDKGAGQPVITIEGDRRRWYELDLPFLISVCKTYGWRSTTLEAIIQGKYCPDDVRDLPSIKTKKDQSDDAAPPTFKLPSRSA